MKTHSLILMLIVPSLATAQGSYGDMLRQALERHPKVAAAKAVVDAERAGKSELMSPFRPGLSLNAYAAGGDGSMIFGSTVDPINYAMLPPNGVAIGNLMFMWKVWSGGRDATASAIGDAKVSAAEQMLETVKQDVALSLRTAYADHFYAAGALQAARDEAASARETERVAAQMEEAGKAPKAFALRASAAARKSEQAVALAESALASARARLEEAAGGKVEVSGAMEPSGQSAPESLAAALSLGEQRAEIEFFVAMARAKGLEATAVRRSLLPEVSLIAMGGPMAVSSGAGDSSAKFGLVFSVPISDGGSRGAKIRQSQAREQEFLAQLDQMKLQIKREIESAWSEWEASAKVTESAKAGLASAQESFDVERLRFESGKSIIAELLDSQSALTRARLDVVDAARYRTTALARLLRSVGSPTNITE